MVNQFTESSPDDSADAVRDELKSDVSRLKSTAEDQVGKVARAEKDQVVKSAKSASSAMDAAAEKLRDDNNAPAWMASAVSTAAQQVDDLAGRLQNKSPQDIARETSRFGRENPTAFLAASAAVGFAAARFLRAGAEYHENPVSGSGYQPDQTSFSGDATSSSGFQSSPAGSPLMGTSSATRETRFSRPGEPQ